MATSNKWTSEDIPDQTGKIALVTGANTGLGYETMKALGKKHDHVILACRNPAKSGAARDEVHREIGTRTRRSAPGWPGRTAFPVWVAAPQPKESQPS